MAEILGKAFFFLDVILLELIIIILAKLVIALTRCHRHGLEIQLIKFPL